MPLTYPKEDGQRHHLWLTKTVEVNPNAELKALCGGVHIFAGKDDLVAIGEYAEEADLEVWLTRGRVCGECADRLRERLGMEERDLTDVSGIGVHKAKALRAGGYESIKDLHLATQGDLSDVDGIGNALAARIKADVGSPPGESR